MINKVGYFPEDRIEKPQKDGLSGYDPEEDYIDINSLESQKPSFASEGLRHTARTASRVAERVGGGLGDVYQGLDKTIDSLTGMLPIPELAQKGIAEGGKFIIKGPALYASKPPTSSELKQISLEQTKGYTAANSRLEKGLDEITENASSMLLGGGPAQAGAGGVRGALNAVARNLGISLSGQLAKEGVKELGGSETSQEAARTGTMVLGTLLGQIDPAQIWNRLYTLRDSRVTPQSTVPAQGLLNDFTSFRRQLSLGGAPTPAQNQLLREMDAIESKVVNGMIPVEELTAWQPKLNTMRNNYPDIRWDNRLIDPLRQANQRAIQQYPDPVFQAAHRQANEVFGVAAQTGRMADFIQRSLPESMRGGLLGNLLGAVITSPTGNLGTNVVKGASLAGVGAGLYHGGSILNHVVKSPTLRREYTDLLMNSSQQNLPGFLQNAQKLDSALQEKKVKQAIFNDSDDYIDINEL